MNRLLSAAIGVAAVVLALAVAATGTTLWTGGHGGDASGRVLPVASVSGTSRHLPAASPAARAGHSRPAATPAPERTPARQAIKQETTNQARQRISRFVGVAPSAPIVRSVKSFSRATGVHPALVELYTGFTSPFPRQPAGQVASYGSVPFIQWNPTGAPLKKIDKGKFNKYVRQFAAGVKAFRHHIILSFGHEMNGSWSRWSRPYATPAQFIAAWRLIHNIFRRSRVRNVTWSWDPSHGGSSARQWWPGSAYVDRIGIDGYFRHGQTFKEIFASQLAIIRRFTGKPIFIAETSVERGPGQARQIEGLFHGLRRYHLAGFVWFDINRLEIWRIEGRPYAIRAFRRCTTSTVRCP